MGTGQQPVILSTPGQEPVTILMEGCIQTEQCSHENGLCVGEAEEVAEWLLMAEITGICDIGCKCIAPGQEPVTLTVPGQDPVTLPATTTQSTTTVTTKTTTTTTTVTTTATTRPTTT